MLLYVVFLAMACIGFVRWLRASKAGPVVEFAAR
jgi:hypothetical protein